jgi:uncharacterized protein
MVRILLLIVALSLFMSTARAASFDCAKAAMPGEVAICGNPDISALDSEMGGLWFAFSKVPMLMGSNGARMDDAQDFLKKRAACGGDLSCLRKLYHARISALKQSIAQAMDNYFQLQNADPMVAPWSITALPEPIGKIATAYANDCRKLGGALKDGFDVPRAATGDVDGDGTQDFVLDPQNLQCSAAATAFCGNGGCQIRIAISSDNYAKPVAVLGGQPTLVLKESGTVVDVWVDRSNCNITDRSKACWVSYLWSDGKLKPTYQARPLPE